MWRFQGAIKNWGNFSIIPTHTTTLLPGWSMYTAEIILIFPCSRKSFTFTRRRCFHFVANVQEKIGVIVIPRILLSFICKPKSHIFQILFKDFPKGILHIIQKDEKTLFLEQNEPKMQKFEKLRFSCMSLAIQNCTFLKIPIGIVSRVFRMCQKKNKKLLFWLKMSKNTLI